MGSIAEEWFGSQFSELHPLLQDLHRNSGTLVGQIDVSFGQGLAGVIGKRVAARFGVPMVAGGHAFEVSICSESGVLHWVRTFNGQSRFHSRFEPVGRHPDGYWIERSGPLSLQLGVQIVAGDWHWIHQRTRIFGIPVPKAIVPAAVASKSIEQGLYRFSVQVSAPVLGKLFGYSGILRGHVTREAAVAGCSESSAK
jgi:hypothetical protein